MSALPPNVTDAVLLASRALVGVAARSLAEVEDEVTLPQFRALVVLASHERNLGELAEALDVHPSSATRLCTRLEAKGLITRRPATQSRRELLVSLTRGPDARRHRHPPAPARDRAHRRAHPGAGAARARPHARRLRAGSRRDARAVLVVRLGAPVNQAIVRGWNRLRTAVIAAFAVRSRQVLLLAAVAGAVTGFGVAFFETIVVELIFDHLLDLPLWALALMPTIGLVIATLSLRVLGPATPGTTDAYLQAFHDPDEPLTPRSVPARMVAAIGTLGFGGAMGLEGPSLYLGASIGAGIQARFHRFFRSVDHRVLMVAGAASGVAAIFKAPATGAVFALEVPYQDDFARKMLLPALVAAASGYLAFVSIHGTTALVPASGSPALSAADLIGSIALGIAGGLVARAFAALLRRAKLIATSARIWMRIAASGAATAAFLFIGDRLAHAPVTIGVGYQTIAWALEPRRTIWILLAILVLRALTTAATISGGGVGGLFIPLVVTGALLGHALGLLIPGLDDSLAVIVGVAAVLGAGYRVPLAAVVFVAEATGRPGFIVPALLAAVAADLMMGRRSVTTYQQPAA